jgi:hypothetical protein
MGQLIGYVSYPQRDRQGCIKASREPRPQ